MALDQLKRFCEMCGSTENDHWQTCRSRRVVLRLRPRFRDLQNNWTICNECHAGTKDSFHPNRTVRLTMGHILDKSKGGKDEPSNLRAVCTNCNEGLQNAAPQKPDRIQLLSQVRRATIDNQQAVLDWLQKKFGITK